MPTEDIGKSKFYLVDKNGQTKELGTGRVESISVEAEGQETYNTCSAPEGEFTFNIQTKKYRRKRFKKLLMSRGVERNWAEIYSRWLNRTQLELDIFF